MNGRQDQGRQDRGFRGQDFQGQGEKDRRAHGPQTAGRSARDSARQAQAHGAQRVLPLSAEAEKARREETVLFRQYTSWRRSQIDALLAGPLGPDVQALRSFLRRLAPDAKQPVTGRDLVEYVRDAAWLRTADDDSRATVRRMIAAAIVWAREKRGLPPHDEPLWDQPQSAGQAVHEMLRERLASPVRETPP